MLNISQSQSDALESDLLRRWKMKLVSKLRHDYVDVTDRSGFVMTTSWVKSAMESGRSIGITAYPDLEKFVVLLFDLTEVRHDDIAAAEFLAIMVAEENIMAKIAMLDQGFLHAQHRHP